MPGTAPGGPAVPLLAHGVPQRVDLPLPPAYAAVAAAAAVLLTLAVLSAAPARARPARAGRPLPSPVQRLARAARGPVRGLVLLLSVGVVVVALAGPEETTLNLAPYALYLTFWAALVPLSLLLGPFYREVNPLRTLHALLERLVGVGAGAGTRPVPAHYGYWPAAGGLAVFLFLELVYPEGSEPRIVGTYLVLQAAVGLAMAQVHGPAWFERGDPFEAWSTLVGRLAPLRRDAAGRLSLGGPGLAALPGVPGLAALLVLLLGATAFDGLSRTRLFRQHLELAGALGKGAALIGCVAVVGGLYAAATSCAGRALRQPAAVAATGSAGGWSTQTRGLAAAGSGPIEGPVRGRRPTYVNLTATFAPSLVPVAAGYAVAHYFSALLREGQTTFVLASDPFRTGADLFGTAEHQIALTWPGPRLVAGVQVAAIVLGHLAGVLLADRRTRELFAPAEARRLQVVYGLLMVGLTGFAVLLLLSP